MGKKKANGEGSITKRKDGRYMGRYTVESKRKAVYGDSFEEVRQKLNEILNEIAKGAYVEPNKYSVEKWLREWLELYALPTVLVSGVHDPVLSGATNRFLSENRKPIDRIS